MGKSFRYRNFPKIKIKRWQWKVVRKYGRKNNFKKKANFSQIPLNDWKMKSERIHHEYCSQKEDTLIPMRWKWTKVIAAKQEFKYRNITKFKRRQWKLSEPHRKKRSFKKKENFSKPINDWELEVKEITSKITDENRAREFSKRLQKEQSEAWFKWKVAS